MRRFLRECVSEHHPLYSSFAQFLSAAFSVVDQEDLQRLKDAYIFCGIHPANPTKQHIRVHCRTKIPQPKELIQRVEGVFRHFFLAQDPNGLPLFKPSMLKAWRIQRVHMLRGCLSDPEVEGAILYRHGGMVQLNHVQGEGAKVPVWIPIRGTSQQEGYHFHQAQWVTGTRVSIELFQAQGMTGVARWNYQRLVDLKQPDVSLPAVFDPVLIEKLNAVSKRVLGDEKYPALHLSPTDTGEKFGLEYIEPGCRPVPLDWDKHRTSTGSTHALHTPPLSSPPMALSRTPQASSMTPTRVLRFPACPSGDASTGSTHALHTPPLSSPPMALSRTPQASSMTPTRVLRFPACPSGDAAFEPDASVPKPRLKTESPYPPPLPLLASPIAARTGPVKTGGRIFVLDHKRWPAPMKKVIDDLLNKHRGHKDMLKLVDQDYAALVHNSCKDPNNMLHPTTKVHISQYIKHLSKLINTASSINTSPEKLHERQQLWYTLTQGSETMTVPVVTMPVSVVNPPPPVQTLATPLTQDSIEEMVKNIMEKQQEQLRLPHQAQKRAQTKTCLSCGQPKSKYLNDGSSIHFFYQQGPIRYFYCSTKVFKVYGGEGLTNPRMPFEDFSETEFFQRELDATKMKAEERGQQKRKRSEPEYTGRKCRFCKLELKQGPNSPHVHTGFPGMAGKYIYCPSKIFSLYKDLGMENEMTWREFEDSAFYEIERQRWESEKRK
ncbi:uncharacterized protein Hap1MRO34_020533 [Clarias gariepinus]